MIESDLKDLFDNVPKNRYNNNIKELMKVRIEWLLGWIDETMTMNGVVTGNLENVVNETGVVTGYLVDDPISTEVVELSSGEESSEE